MKAFERINDSVYRTTLPYKDIFTTVYLLWAGDEAVLFDAASFDADFDVLYPLLCAQGVTSENLKYIFISHNHTDHAGGLARLIQAFPETCIVTRSEALAKKYAQYRVLQPVSGDMLLDTFRVIPIPGHTADSAALLDIRTNTLVTGDCLQLYGIFGSEDWAANINFPAEHYAALRALREIGIDEILSAHDYHPYSYRAVGREAVERYIAACEEPLARMRELIAAYPDEDDEEIRLRYNASGNIPTVRARVIGAVRAAMQDKK